MVGIFEAKSFAFVQYNFFVEYNELYLCFC